MPRIYFDIETLPGQQPGAREQARANLKPPGNMKKPDTIAAWWETEGESAAEESYRRQALDGAEGEICSIAWAMDNEPPAVHVRQREQDEASYLREVFDKMRTAFDIFERINSRPEFPEPSYCIGHNVDFDLGFIRRRAWVHNILLPGFFPRPTERLGRDYGDTMTMWAGYGQRISLDRLCKALGIPSPKAEGVDGSQVFDLWQAGEYARIAEYNMRDVVATRACWLRMAYEDDAVEVVA